MCVFYIHFMYVSAWVFFLFIAVSSIQNAFLYYVYIKLSRQLILFYTWIFCVLCFSACKNKFL